MYLQTSIFLIWEIQTVSKLFKKGKEILPMDEWGYNLICSMCEEFNK